MNMLQYLFGRAVRARRPRAEILSPPVGQPTSWTDGKPVAKRNATLRGLVPLLVVAGLLVNGSVSTAQIVTFEFSALGGAEATATNNSKDANLANCVISRSPTMPSVAGNGGRFNSTNWAVTSIANAITGGKYMEFTITPNSGYQFSVSSIYVQWQRSATGNRGVSLRSSVDSYASALDTDWSLSDVKTTQNKTWTFTQGNSTDPVTYRLYSWAEAITGTGGPGDGSGNDIVIYGTVSAAAAEPSITLANNGTQITTANVATGTVAHVLSKFQVGVATANATLTAVAITTSGYDSDDVTNLKLWYSTDNSFSSGSDTAISTITGPGVAGAESFSGLSQVINSGSTGYFFITADLAAGATYGNSASVAAIGNADLSFSSGSKSGSADAAGAQTFIATAPTSNGSVGTFTSVGADAMTVNWTSGNGERRIVVVRSGSATSWTPSDGTIPSGINANFSSATDQGSGNKVCYDGTGTSFALSGLSASTTYHVTIFEYNGTTTYVKYYTAGTEASGSQATTAAGGIWINPMSAGTPAATYYLGDTMGEWYYNFEIGQASWNAAQVGIGTATDGTGYSWAVANWYEDGSGSNKRVRRNLSGYQYTSVGNHYVICQAKANSGDTFTSKSGGGYGNPTAYPPADLSSAYFTCSALVNPSAQSATAASASQINLSWTRGVSGGSTKDTVVFRSTSSTPPTLTQGSSYSQGTTYGAYYCVYKGNGTSHNDSASLSAGTRYYYYFHAENWSYYSAGVTANATTWTTPSVTTVAANPIAATSATLGGNVTADGGTSVTDRGVVYKTTAGVTIANNKTQIGTGTGSFGQSIGSLAVNQVYYFRAYAQNSVGTTLGTELNFTTLANVPSAPTVNNPTATTLDVAVNANGNPAGTTFAIRLGAQYVQANGSLGGSAVWQTAATWGTVTVTGLASGTSHAFGVAARNGASVATAYGSTASGLTICAAPATPTAGSITTTGFTASWSATTGAASYRLDVATDSGFTAMVSGYNNLTVTGTSQAISGLTPGRTYYVRIRAVNASGTSANSATLTQAPDCFTTGPTIGAATSIGTTDFTANWSAVTGASGYQLDVSTNAVFGGSGGGSTTNLWEDFVSFTSNESTDISSSLNSYTRVTGWTGDRVYSASGGGQSKLGASSGKGYLTTPTIDLSSNSGDAYVLFDAASWSGDGATLQIYHASDGSTFSQVGSDISLTESMTTYSNNITGGTANSKIQFSAKIASKCRIYLDEVYVMQGGGSAPSFVPGYSNLTVSAGTSQSVTGLTANTEYFYRVRATNAFCTSANSGTGSATTTTAAASTTLANNEAGQTGAGTVAAGTTSHVLHTFKLTVADVDTTLSALSVTTAGNYATGDLTNLKLWHSTDNSFASGSDTSIQTLSSPGAAGVKDFTSLGQSLVIGTHYFFVTADLSATAAAGKTISIGAIANAAVTLVGTKSGGPTTAGGAQTITSAVTIDNTGAPSVGTLAAGTADAVVFGFRLSPASGSIDFTGVTVTVAGTATSGDLSSFEVVYDADNSGTYNAGDSIVSASPQAIGGTLVFSISGQTGISAARRYLVIADVAASPTAGRTFTGSIASAGNVTTTGTESGTAAGNQQTIITKPIVTTPTAISIGQTAATLGATVTATGGATVSERGTVYGASANPTGNGATSGDGTGVFSHERTGLSQGTKYFYRGYAVNTVGTAYSPDGSFFTEPGQAASVTFANVGTTAMRISWTGGAGSDGAIVVVRAGSAVADGPTDGTLHNASTTFGSGANLGNSSYVVHRGAGTQVDVTGLTAGTTYHVAVYAYKGTVATSGTDQGINYRQTSPATGNKPTMAAEPTTHASSLSFSNLGAYSMDLSWTSGNGANRIVVVRQGAATSWAPTDGAAPSGDSADYSAAGDKGSGNKICYSGSGNSFTLSGLDPGTTYHVTIFEYNGSGTEVNYLTSGTPLTGNETTTEAACVPAQVRLLQRSAYYTAWESGGGIFNNGSDTNELGQWANSGSEQSVAWRTFNTSGNGSGDARALEPGDRFRITVYGTAPGGVLGLSLNDGASMASWADRTNSTRGYIQVTGGVGNDLYATYGGGSASWPGIRPNASQVTMEYHILSSKEMTANIVGQTPKYDLSMLNSPSDTDRIDGYSIYLNDDAGDVYWKQDTTITNLGYVEFGADNGTRTIAGKITDGTDPHCTEVPSANFLKKSGSGTITLGNTASTYTLYTDIAGGTLSISADGALGTAPATVSPAHLRLSSAGAAFVALDTFTLNANRGLTLSNWAYLAVADSKILTYNGVVTDGAGSYKIVKNQGGELILGGNNTYDGGSYIDAGTLTLKHANAAGTGSIFVGQDAGNLAATLKLGLATTFANNLTIRTESTGIKYLSAPETATLSGTLAIAETDDDRFTVDVASGKILTLSGVMSGDSDGGKITKTGAGTLTLSNAGNTHDKKVQINAGTVAISASRNLGADPGGAYASKITLHGGTLRATASFALHQHYLTTLGANNGFLQVDPTYTLTVPGAMSGSGGFGKTGTGTLKLTAANTFTGPMTNSAGTVQIGDNGTSGSVSANIVNNAALVWHRSDNVTYSGVISGTGTLEKRGAGVLTLSGVNTYSGNTTVSAGTLLVSGSAANSAVTVSSGATLMGDGPIGNLTIGGLVDPGNSAGARATLVADAVTLQAGGSMRVDVSNVDGAAGTGWDLIDASGTIAVNGTGTFTIYLHGASTGFDSRKSYEWTVMDGTVSGFDAARIAIDSSNFSHNLDGGMLSIAEGSLKVKFTPRAAGAPATFYISETNAASLKLAFTLNANSDPLVIVYNTTGFGDFTTPTGTAPGSGSFAGGTVVYNGSTSPHTHSGLTGCTLYYYKAWSYNGTNYSASGLTASETTATPVAPTGLFANPTNSTDFTANWAAAAGASGYRLDVSTRSNFTAAVGGGGSESFSNSSATASYATGDYTGDNGVQWYYVASRNEENYAIDGNGIMMRRTADSSKVYSAGVSGGIDTFTCSLKKGFTGAGNRQVELFVNNVSKGTCTAWDNTTVQTFTVSNINVSGVVTIRVDNVTAYQVVIDDISWTGYGSTGAAYVPGYSNLTVAGTSQSVTGLTSETTYYYRVRAEGAGSCTSAHSTTASVTTVAATPYVALANNGTQVAAASVAGGTTAHILHRFQLTVTNADATLTGVGFTSAGSYVAADLSNFKVWYSANNTLETGSDTLLGTISTGLGAGAHSLSSLSQGITTNAIGYIFITADIAANPGCEKTISVAAITTGDLTYAAAATETGSTTAGGVQTLVAAEPTLHASALLFPSVGSDQLGVSWTSGNGDKRIVVVTEYDAAGLWLFDEGSGTTAKDATVNANDGTLYNTPTWSSRTGGGGALDFDNSSSEYVEVLNSLALQTTNSQTISLWVKPDTFYGRQNPWNKAYGGEGTITLEPNQTLNFYWGTAGANTSPYQGFGSSSTLTASQWKHIVVVRDLVNNTLRWYFNGAQVATTTPSYAAATASTENLWVGRGYAGYFDGEISEPMLLDRALTATEVANLYAMGSLATGWVPTDGTVPSGVNSDFSAADDQAYHSKIVYDGTGTNVTVTGLKPDTAYRVRVYEYNGAGACVNYLTDGTPASAVQPTACPAAPTGLFANPTNTYDFTANWSASTGARGYIIDVSTTNTFGGTGGLTLIDEDFVSFPDWTDNGTSSDTTATHYGAGRPCRALADGSTLISPAVDYPTQLVFYVDASGTGNGKKTTNYYSLDGTTWLPISTFTVTDAGATLVNDLTTSPNLANATNVQFKFVGVTTWYLDDVKVTGGLVGSYVPGYEHLPVSGTSVSVTGLEDSVTYYWRVAATGARCTGDYSVVTNVTTIAGPPPVPPNVSATDGTILGHVQVTWTDLNNKEQNFLVWRSTSSDSNTAAVIATLAANTVSYNDTTAALGTRYWYWVMSSNAMGASALSVSDSGFRKLPTVQNVQATDGTSVDYTTITWTDSNAGETGYGIWYGTTANSGSATWLANTAANVATYNHTGTPGQQYYYWVRATNSTLVTQSDLQATGEPGYRKLATVAVSASDGTDTSKVVVNWTDIAGETGYSVWRSETNNSATAEWQANVAANATSYDDEEAVSGTQYYYWVLGTNSTSGSQSDFGAGDGGWRRLVENPSSVELTRDGREMVRAAIAANANTDDILVLYSTLAEVNGTPALNSSYSVGDTLDNAKVIYKGTAPDFREHVVSANTTNHYRVFSVLSNIYYSSGTIPTGSPVETKPYQPNVVVETFSYTNVSLSADSFTNKGGGANWATGSNWVLATSGDASWRVLPNDTYDDRPMFFTAASNQATISGNRAFIDLDGAGRWGNATRQLPTVSTGTLFVSALMAYRYEAGNEGADRWLTMALMNGSDEELEFGKVWGANRTFTIRRSGANASSSYGLNPYGDSTNNWYWVVLKYDFANDTAKAAAFYRGENIPSTEPSTWDVEWSSMSITQVTALRLKAGSGTDWLGGGLFDEVRVSSVWPALLGEPDLVITPESENFGETEVGRTDVQTFWVQNIGGDNVPLSVTSLTLGGTNPTNFFLSTNTLGTIEYGQSNSFTVTFAPHTTQTYAATLFVTNTSGVNPVTVLLQGTGIPSQLTNAPAVDDYWVGGTNQVTDAMVTSGVFSVVIDAFHPGGIATAKYDLLNSASTVILADQAFESWSSANGEDYVFSNATHTGYWPATPADDYLVRVTLISSNGYGTTNTTYGVLGGVEATDLFISEYIEGSSYNKAVEIYNGTGAAVDLSSYTLRLYNNGNTSPSSISLSGTLAAGAVHVVAHINANAAIQAEADQTTGSLDFNGNDVVALAKSGVNIDVLGTIGSSADFAKDVTKVRKSSVTAGKTTYAAGEWDNKASDTTNFLGAHTMDGGVVGTPMRFKVIDDDTAAPVITEPLVNGATTPAGTAVGPSIAIGDVPVGGFSVGWKVQDTDSGVFAASNHYTLKRSNAVVSAGAVTVGANGDGKASALTVSTTVARASMIWGNYVLSLAGHDYDPEWVGDISSVSNVYYFVIAAPSIGVAPASLDFGTVDRDVTSNRTVVLTNSGNADLVIGSIGFTGSGSGYFSIASPAVPLTVTAGDSTEVVVSFTPTVGGIFNNVVMTLNNNTPDHAAQEVPITAVCFDPETAPPSIYDFTAVDSRVVTNEVTDHALGHSEVTLNFTLWHYAGMSAANASYDLLNPAGDLVWTNGTFDSMTGVTLGTKDCQVFSATVPGFYPAVLGVYTARVTATSSNAYSVTDEAVYAPLTAGAGVPHILDRFSRPDALNDIGADWVPTSTGETNKNIQLRDHTLQFYGAGGTAGGGRLSVVRDMAGRYNTVLTNNAGTLTWAFNFYSGQANMTGLGSDKYAGLYVLGSTAANFVGGTGLGYAVRICSNQVALVKFTGGLNADSDATTIGTPANLAATTPMGVRVNLDPATGTWTLYTTNWGGTGPDAFGDPLAAAELATSNVDSTYLGANNLKFVGCYWNHAAATPGTTFGAVFDDVYAPYVMPAAPLMNFTVIDEDWSGPVHSGFNVDNRQYTVSSINPGGLTVTGLVADANGVYAGTSNVWTLFSNSFQVATGTMTMTPNTDGAGMTAAPAALSTNIAFSHLNTTNGTFTFRLVSTDYDVDRPGDSMSITNTFSFTIVDTEAPTPTSVTAVGDGMEMVVLTWNLNAAQGAVVLRSPDAAAIAGASMLSMGTPYNQGDAGPNGTTVAYHGTNQTGVEIVVPMGSSNFFRVFGANGTVYSSGFADPTNSVQLLKYEDGEIVDQFAYTNNYIWTSGEGGTNWVYLNDQAGTGQGWNGGWTGDTHKALTIENINLLCGDTQFPDPYANKLQWVANSQVATNVAITRKLATKRSGRTFIAFMMNYKVGTNSCSLTNKYLGLSLMSGVAADKEEIFFGKLHGRDKDAGINVPGTGEFISNDPYYAFNGEHFRDYMIVGEWEPTNKTIRMWAFYQGDTNPIPQEYTNAKPIATYSSASFSVADITGIRLAAGMTEDDTNSLDHVYFDEVRVGDTWDEVLLFNYPEAWNFRVGEQRGSGTNAVYVVTDGELAETGKAYPISYLLNHRTGVTNAQFNISTNTSYLTGLYNSNIDLQLNPANATDRSRWFTNWVTTRLHTNDITLGVYTTRVWMTAVSGKATNTIFMEGRAGATDLFFGEFGEGRYWDKYVEIYNGTGGTIDLSKYFIAHQNYGPGIYPDYTKPWINFCHLSPTSHILEHGKTMLILNGEPQNYTDPNATLKAMTNALIAAGREYLITTNLVLQVSGNDPVGLFHESNTSDWIDMCGIAPDAGTRERYIMYRLENAEVPRRSPLVVDSDQWHYRDWAQGTVVDSPEYTNFLKTAGLYDINVGLGGYITFRVEDDDAEPPRMGTNSALMVGTEAPYTSLAPSNGAVEVVLTAWNFVGTTVEEAGRPWADSLLTNASVSGSPAYTPELIDHNNSGTSENDLFDGYDQPNKGIAGMSSIGTYFTQAETAWIQYEIELTSAEEMVLSWAEAGGSAGFDTAQIQWSSDGQTFNTNAAWPSWVPQTGGAATYATRYAEFDGVVPPGLAKVYIRIVLGPGYGTASGTYRMDNVQLTGYPQEFQVTDGQIAASGNKFQFRANVYDTNSGLNKAQATMKLQNTDGTRVASKDIGDGSTTNSTLWWELDVTRDDITDYVNASLSGKGMTINVQVPDLDADRPNDQSWLNGRIGQVRVIDDDTKRPKLTLTSMKPLTSILAQWAQMTDTNSLLPTKSDAGVDAEPLKTKSGTDDPKNPNFSRLPTNGYHYIEAFAWHGQKKCWLIEVTPEADMALTNLTFTSYMHRTNGVSNYRIDHYVDGLLEANILTPTYWVDPPAMLDPTVWYTRSHGWAPDTVVLEAGKVNQIRLYGLGSSNPGARWRISELTLWQAATSTDGVTEVTDAEFTSGTFKLTGHAWDTGSGIASPTHATPAKRPMFSLNAPDGGVLVSNQLFAFTGEVLNGGATTKEEGAFEGMLPTPVYTNVMLGGYTGEAHVWDYDDDRTDDDLRLRGDLAMYVVDNDIGEPTTVGTLRVNGHVVPGTAPDRFNVAWTNQPGFIVSFDSVAVDQDPGDTYSAKQRALTGIGEYRVGTNASINSLTASNRATLGKPYPVATTNGALANYGFEMPGQGWTHDANCTYRSLAMGGTNEVKEGTNSLRQVNGGVAYQTIEFRNAAAATPKVGVSGWYRSDTVGGPTFRIQAFATNNLTTPVATRNLQPGIATTWTRFEIDPAEEIGNGTVEVLKISLIVGGGSTTFWDDIRLSVDIGANTPSMRFTAGAENQGLNPQYLFAVDSDNNRAGDRLAGEAKPFYIAYDITPPTMVGQNTSLKASTDSVDDPTTQFDLQWSTQNVGPDDLAHTNHPDYPSASNRDLLSPWQTYKIYYGAYDVLDIPAGDPGPGSVGAYIYTNFIQRGLYKAWSNRVWNSAINDPGAPTFQANYHALTNVGRTTIRLYDLDFDQDYAMVIVGVDKAGNEGSAGIYSWATNNTIKFALTRGWCMAKEEASTSFPDATLTNALTTRAAALAWTASGVSNTLAGGDVKELYSEVKKDYDLIYWDASSFRESAQNDWKLLGTVRSNWFVDDGGQGRKRGNLRFYRASYKDRWRKTRLDGTNIVAQRPIASEEIYAQHNVILSPGQNFVALHGVPYSNTFEAVFGGTETFPGNDSALAATKVEFFTPGMIAGSSAQYYLNASGRWIEVGNAQDVTTNMMATNLFNSGFSITLPNPLPPAYVVTNALDYNSGTNWQPAVVDAMIWSPIAQVPTNGFSQVIHCGSQTPLPNWSETLVYNVVALRLPVATHPSKMRLLDSGFVSGNRGQSDEIYTINTATKNPLQNTKIYCETNGIWKFTANNKLVPGNFFQPNDVIVIISRNPKQGGGTNWTWSYHPGHFYPNEKLPDRWMGQ